MRTTELKIGNEKKEAILVAGGAGFKIYTVSGLDSWVLVLGRKIFVIEEQTPEFKTVARYVNLKYQPAIERETIKSSFSVLVASRTLVQKTQDSESNP